MRAKNTVQICKQNSSRSINEQTYEKKELLREQKNVELAFTSKNIKEMHKLGMYLSIWSKQASF